MAGAPKGNSNGSKGRKATDALHRAIDVRDGHKEMPAGEEYSVLVAMWDKQIEKALDGDGSSMNMIVERLDGKPKQAIVGGDEDDSPVLHKIVREIVRPKHSDS